MNPNIRAKKKRYNWRKALFTELLGGECVSCGATDKLEFDHVMPGEVNFRIIDGNGGLSKPLDVALAELQKCQLLCNSCHWDKTASDRGLNRAQHGTPNMYNNYKCRCGECAHSWAIYYRLRRRAKI